MAYLTNFKMNPITLVSTLALTNEQIIALNNRIDDLHTQGDFMGEVVVTKLDSCVTQITAENTMNYKIGNTVYGPQDLLGPILNDHQSCRAVTISIDSCGLVLNIDDVAFNKHGLLTAEQASEQTSNYEGPFSDLKNVTLIPENELFKIHGLSGLQWHRADTTLEYLSTSRFSITEQNAKKLQDEINKYEWGEHDTPIVDFNDETDSAFISGACSDHGTFIYPDDEDEIENEDDIEETIELSDLLTQYANAGQTIKVIDIALYKYDSYVFESEVKIHI